MASVSASHLILFIASMMIAASVAGVFTDSIGQLSGAISEQGFDVSSEVRTDVEIISDSGSDAVYQNGNITLYVKNTGTERLAAESGQLDIFVNGQFATAYEVTRADGDGAWQPGTVVRVDIDPPQSSLSGDVRVQLTVNGDEEVFNFRV
ncbi:flagellar protein G [Haloarcula onubensis]|uniref:Flagellar protein G n=1 Tax=Haloarcula onubensis TaxID=2950539 RepID=A0ABU2FML2_9EURY|nr:flagellar protein G [Halomicroarcula sp. S3CR25-11]MDS0281994.1 flagellar protein G [Halomicroarcula sp. S3CR25-11]